MKFASKRVNGWDQRYIKMIPVVEALQRRIRNGYSLDFDERKFIDDVVSLKRIYSSGHRP